MGNRFMQPLRITIQWLYLFFIVYLGIRFYQFVAHFRSNGICRRVLKVFCRLPHCSA